MDPVCSWWVSGWCLGGSPRLPLAMTWRFVWHPQTTTKPVVLNNVTGILMFHMASPDVLTPVTSAQCELRVPMVNLPTVGFFGKCQSSCTVLCCEHRSYWRTLGPHVSLMCSSLVRNMHTNSLLEVILKGLIDDYICQCCAQKLFQQLRQI